MEDFNVHDKFFRPVANVENGDVDLQTVFHYRQKGPVIWATYEGGAVLFGTLSGSIKGNKINFVYQHHNQSGAVMTGRCETLISSEKGLMRLSEKWQWTCGDHSSGTSELIEIE